MLGAQRLDVAHFAIEQKAAFNGRNRLETAFAIACEQQAVAAIVAALVRADPVQVAAQQHIQVAVAVGILHVEGEDFGDLGLEGQVLGFELLAAHVFHINRFKPVHFPHIGTVQILLGENLFQRFAGKGMVVGEPAVDDRRHLLAQFILARHRKPFGATVVCQYMIQAFVVIHILDVHFQDGTIAALAEFGVGSQVAEHKIHVAVLIKVGGGDGLPKTIHGF